MLNKFVLQLVDDYATDAQVQGLVDKYQFYLIPIINPDGYDWTWTDVRYQIKSICIIMACPVSFPLFVFYYNALTHLSCHSTFLRTRVTKQQTEDF